MILYSWDWEHWQISAPSVSGNVHQVVKLHGAFWGMNEVLNSPKKLLFLCESCAMYTGPQEHWRQRQISSCLRTFVIAQNETPCLLHCISWWLENNFSQPFLWEKSYNNTAGKKHLKCSTQALSRRKSAENGNEISIPSTWPIGQSTVT